MFSYWKKRKLKKQKEKEKRRKDFEESNICCWCGDNLKPNHISLYPYKFCDEDCYKANVKAEDNY